MQKFDLIALSRRSILGMLALAAFAGRAQTAQAEGFPDRPLRLVVPYPAGGSTDVIGRLIGKSLFDVLGKPVVIDNRSGAAGAIGTSEVAHAAPDGYTLLVHILTTAVLNPLTRTNLSYDPVNDLQPVALVAKLPNVMIINKNIPAQNIKDFVSWARANQKRASYGTGGVGSVMHLTGELLKREAGFEMIHVPYRGAALAIQDLMAGNISAVFDNITGVMGAIRSGEVRAIGITTERRVAALPDVPTFAESGFPKIANSSWLGIFTRAGVARAISARLEAAMAEVNMRPELIAAMSQLGAVSAPMGAADLNVFWKNEFVYWKQAVAIAGVKLE